MLDTLSASTRTSRHTRSHTHDQSYENTNHVPECSKSSGVGLVTHTPTKSVLVQVNQAMTIAESVNLHVVPHLPPKRGGISRVRLAQSFPIEAIQVPDGPYGDLLRDVVPALVSDLSADSRSYTNREDLRHPRDGLEAGVHPGRALPRSGVPDLGMILGRADGEVVLLVGEVAADGTTVNTLGLGLENSTDYQESCEEGLHVV